jgi:hypothetical protein
LTVGLYFPNGYYADANRPLLYTGVLKFRYTRWILKSRSTSREMEDFLDKILKRASAGKPFMVALVAILLSTCEARSDPCGRKAERVPVLR